MTSLLVILNTSYFENTLNGQKKQRGKYKNIERRLMEDTERLAQLRPTLNLIRSSNRLLYIEQQWTAKLRGPSTVAVG